MILKVSPLVLSFFLFIPFPWRETKLFTRQVKVQVREKYFNHNKYKGNMPTLAGKKQLSFDFVLYRPRLFRLLTKSLRVWSVGNGYQSAYSRADTMNNHINEQANGTRRAQIPRKPLEPPISWIVTQLLIYITSYFLSNSKYVIYFCQDSISSRPWILSIVNEKPFCNGLIMQLGKIENQQRTNTSVFTLTFI